MLVSLGTQKVSMGSYMALPGQRVRPEVDNGSPWIVVTIHLSRLSEVDQLGWQRVPTRMGGWSGLQVFFFVDTEIWILFFFDVSFIAL
jgi:hypothetical protein